MMELVPACLPFYYKEGVKHLKIISQNPAVTSAGYLVPCCWCDAPAATAYITAAGLLDPEMHLSTVTKVDEVVLSPAWRTFFKVLIEAPATSPKCCRTRCGGGGDPT